MDTLGLDTSAILDSVPIGIAVLRNRRYVWVNPAMSELSGFAESDLIGQTTGLLYADVEDYERVGEEARCAFSNGSAYEADILIRRKDNELRWMTVSGKLINSSEPSQGSVWFMQDITERRRIKDDLQYHQHHLEEVVKERTAEVSQRHAQLQTILNAIPGVVGYWDKDQQNQFANPAYQDWLGLSPEQIRGKHFRDVFGPERYDEVLPYVEAALCGKLQSFEDVFRPSGQSGEPRHAEIHYVPDYRDAEVAGFFVMAFDITKRKNAEKELLQRTKELSDIEAQLREALSLNANILMTSAVGFAAYRQDGQCVMVNPAFANIIGGTEDLLLKQNFRQVQSWRDSGLLSSAERVLVTGSSDGFETQLTTTFGRELWLYCQLFRFGSEDEPHLLLMFHDITEEKKSKDALLERERSFRTLAGNVPDNIMRCDREGRITYVNKTLERTLGRTADELVGKTIQETSSGDRVTALAQAVRRVGATGNAENLEHLVPGPDSRPRHHTIRIAAELGSDGKPISVLAVGRDVTDERLAEEELRLAACVFHNSAEGVLVTNTVGTILSVNPAFTEITGYTAKDVIGKRPNVLRSEHHDKNFYKAMWEALKAEEHWEGDIWNRRKNGEAYLQWMTISAVPDNNGKPIRYVSVFHDVTEARNKDEHIRHLAFHDALTGLPNRALFQERLEHALSRSKRDSSRLSVTFIDLDGFKAVNDTLGHDVGDLLLKEMANRISARLRRASDTVARLGGDEFVVLMEDLKEIEHCACLADEIITDISRVVCLRGHSIRVGASMGMAFYPNDGDNAQELMKRADVAMYAAKASGKGTYRFFSERMMDDR